MAGDLASAALNVLEANRRGTWTCPAAGIYPHQWLWDSCFVAVGLAAHDPQRAADEVRAALRGQWTNGMVPHMVFDADVDDLGSSRLWRSRRDARAPRDVDTSCITQPPVLAVAAWYVWRHLEASEQQPFLEDVVPRIARYHAWLYRERDPGHCGLVTLIHPWESGLDTTPPWTDALNKAVRPLWLRFVLRWRLTRLVRLFRRDTRYVPAVQRSSDDDGLRLLVLARRAERYEFDLARLPPSRSVLIQDVGFNALLIVANRMLSELADRAGMPLDPDLVASSHATVLALEELWEDATERYCSREATTGALVTAPTVASFVALWAGSRPDRMRRLIDALRSEAWWPRFPIPSVSTDSPEFDSERYWKGPTWINTNWLVIQGLRAQHHDELADELQQSTIRLVRDGGFAEYFSPLTGEAFGADHFSWTAALTLELLRPSPDVDRQ